jgi:hypothetical protein
MRIGGNNVHFVSDKRISIAIIKVEKSHEITQAA